MKESEAKSPDTQDRLLQAAGEVFAQHGFRAATVREISGRAKANVAAVNYHFGDKGALYAAVLKYALTSVIKKYPPDLDITSGASPEERLHAFIRSLLYRILDEGRPAWHGKLMAREIAEPTGALDELVEEAIKPLYEYLTIIVKELMGGAAEKETVRLCAMSIIGQCLYYHHARPVILRLYQLKLGRQEVEGLASHITHFSMGAIKELSKRVSSKTCGEILTDPLTG